MSYYNDCLNLEIARHTTLSDAEYLSLNLSWRAEICSYSPYAKVFINVFILIRVFKQSTKYFKKSSIKSELQRVPYCRVKYTMLSLACSVRCCSDSHISTGITWLFHSAQLDHNFRHFHCAVTCLAILYYKVFGKNTWWHTGSRCPVALKFVP